VSASCPICGADAPVELQGLYDDRYGYPGLFDLHRCPACGHRHVPVSLQPAELRRLYTEYYPRSDFRLEDFQPHQEVTGVRAWWRGSRSAAFRWVPRGVRVLDIGCGFGQTLAYHQGRGCEAHGVDADENILRVAERYGLKARAGLFDPAHYPPGYFDYVTLDQVLEHSLAPGTLMEGVAQVLKPGGYAIVSTPNASGIGRRVFRRRWVHWHCPYHVQFFTRRSLEKAAEAAGLRVLERQTVTPSAWLHYQWLHLLAYPRQGDASTFWRRGQRAASRRTLGVRVAHAFNRLRLNHVITRVLDAIGLGDNQVFVLRKPA
jgi:2-polyprenyl-3-methyl-5-hydroxy-6-metoxy-1,4-benzoquinol methylase